MIHPREALTRRSSIAEALLMPQEAKMQQANNQRGKSAMTTLYIETVAVGEPHTTNCGNEAFNKQHKKKENNCCYNYFLFRSIWAKK